VSHLPYYTIRTSKLTLSELWRTPGWFTFPVLLVLKMLRIDLPMRGRYLIPACGAIWEISLKTN